MPREAVLKRRWILWPIICALIVVVVCWWWCRCRTMTTVILVRHAEKANVGGDNPPLSTAGQARAQDLADALADADLAAVFATEWQRTQLTVQPTADDHGLAVQQYGAGNSQAIADQVLADHGGETILVCGHSNTVPAIIELLGGGTVDPIGENDYDNLYVVTRYSWCGAKLLRLHYGDTD